MTDQALHELTRQIASGDSSVLSALADRLAELLAPLDRRTRDEVLFAVVHQLVNRGNAPSLSSVPASQPLTPELREWLLQQTDVEQALANLRELRERGGLELDDFLPELERAANP
jgi:hypothetical protein